MRHEGGNLIYALSHGKLVSVEDVPAGLKCDCFCPACGEQLVAKKDKKGRSNLRYYSNYQPDYLYVTIQKEWCEEITDIEFAGETLMASKHAHEVLTWVYGDYMKLPPEAERVPAHSTIDIQVFDEEA